MVDRIELVLPSYRRPDLPSDTYTDADGNRFEYGKQYWGGTGRNDPPEEAYSRVSHPWRFDPIHRVANALYEALVSDFDVVSTAVDVKSDPDFANIAHYFGPDYECQARTLTLRNAPDATPIMLLWGHYLGDDPNRVRSGTNVFAGALFHEWFPDCGCDACDDSLVGIAEHLERQIAVLLTAPLRERLVAAPNLSGYTLDPGGPNYQGSESNVFVAWSKANAERLADLPNGVWQPWLPNTA